MMLSDKHVMQTNVFQYRTTSAKIRELNLFLDNYVPINKSLRRSQLFQVTTELMTQIRDNFKLIKLRPLNGEKTFSFSEYYGQDFDRF